jgi:BCD family chlorophyll transporter-like MFS transporter
MMAPFLIGNFLIGFGGALFGHGTLTATMNRAPESQAGLALGAWGSVQATAAGLAMALSGVLRDVVNAVVPSDGTSVQAVGYEAVYGLEIVLLVVTIWAISPLVPRLLRPTPKPETAAEPAAESAGGAC